MFKDYLAVAWRNIKRSKAYSALNILGLAAFTAEQKTREIGIRKVLGASTSEIIARLSRDFMKWVVAAANPAESMRYE